MARVIGGSMARPYKLTPEQVREIRKNRYGKTDKAQAAKYGVHKNTIFRVRHEVVHARIRDE